MLNVIYAECHFAECRYAECHGSQNLTIFIVRINGLKLIAETVAIALKMIEVLRVRPLPVVHFDGVWLLMFSMHS